MLCVSRCADAAVLPVASCETDSWRPQGAPDVMELIPSSQGSPIINPPDLMLRLSRTNDHRGLCEPDEACAGAPLTPASSMVRSFLLCRAPENWPLVFPDSLVFGVFLKC